MQNYIVITTKAPIRLGLTLLCLFLLYACGNDRATSLQDNIDATVEKALFNPADSVIPFPSDLLFNGSTDGTLNIPVDNPLDYSDPKVALNTAWGFGTTTPISTTFSSPIDAASINGDSVRVYEVTLSSKPGGAAVAVSGDGRLTFGVNYVASASGNTLLVVPLRPLHYDSSYLVVLTNGLRSTSGSAYEGDLVYNLLKLGESLVDANGNSRVAVVPDPEDAASLEKLRVATNYAENTAVGFDTTLNRDEIILSWTFTTQMAGPVLNEVLAKVSANPTSKIYASSTTDSPNGAASIHVGTLLVPYYLKAASSTDSTEPLTEFWKNSENSFLTPFSQVSREPKKTGDQTIPLLLSIPKSTKPAGGWPVVIFQHGITGNRTNMLAVADTLAAKGMAVVAIDLPLHGVTPADDTYPLRLATAVFDSNAQERLFDLDLVNNDTLATVPDNKPDTSGFHYINLRNLAVTRDNVRQSVADLFTLTKALYSMDYDDNTGNTDFDTSRIYFLGHSLGGIVGSIFLAMEPDVRDAVLAMPGAGLAKLLDGSATFGPIIAGGLQAADNGVVKGTADYEAFMTAAQTVIDPADPINYMDRMRDGRGVLLFEVVGDMVIPNTVPDTNSPAGTVPAPLAGTKPFAALLGLTPHVTAGTTNGSDLAAWVSFSTPDSIGSANHSSVLKPLDAGDSGYAESVAVYIEMQKEFADFLDNDGNSLTISDATYIVAP